MKRNSGLSTVLLLLTGLFCVALLLFGTAVRRRVILCEEETETAMKKIEEKQLELTSSLNIFEKTLTARKEAAAHLSADVQTEAAPSVTPTPAAQNTGHIIGIDPGHQGWSVDMSETEPNGPGSNEMKAKASTGTQGSYTGLPEFQLNLDISLKLRDILEERGYCTVLTRTDNETAISNRERAEYAAAQGAEIYVRIHANGDNSNAVSGALSISPSSQNPYISELYEESNRLSQCILDAYCQTTGFKNLGVKYYDNMTGINWSTIPVTILEMGFMTNENDDRKMSDAAFQDTMAKGIADGIDAYFN